MLPILCMLVLLPLCNEIKAGDTKCTNASEARKRKAEAAKKAFEETLKKARARYLNQTKK